MNKLLLSIIFLLTELPCNYDDTTILNLKDFVYPRYNSSKEVDKVKSKELFNNAQYIFRKKRDYPKAIPIFIEAIKIYPDPQYYFELGNCYIDQKNYKKSIQVFDIAIKLNPQNLNLIYYNAACAASLNKDKDLSIKYLEKSLINNYSDIKYIYKDNDISYIKNDKRFINLMKRFDVSLTTSERKLIGIWQASPVMAAGWTDNYSFFPDRVFIFRYNQMNCSKRIISEKGTWIIKNNKLVLSKNLKEHIEGGKYVDSVASCASNKMLIDGNIITTKINPSKTEELDISEITIEYNKNKVGYNMPCITINGAQYWKARDNPEDYK